MTYIAPTNVVEVLERTRAILSQPKAWTTGVFAKDANGRTADPMDADATCFCLIGAIKRASYGTNADTFDGQDLDSRITDQRYSNLALHATTALRIAIADEFGVEPSIPSFNDSDWREHADVLLCIDTAIKTVSETA
jgi:hypothetical protein